MLQGDIDRFDDATAAAERFAIAYQPSPLAPDRRPDALEPVDVPLGNPAPEVLGGQDLPPAGVIPTESIAWQQAIEQLLKLIGTAQPDVPPENLMPAAYVTPPAVESDATTAPPPMAADPGPGYVIESLGSEQPPLLSLDESDLFGDAEPPAIDLLKVDAPEPAAAFQGMDSDLFGPSRGVDPISVGKNDNGARSIKPANDPDIGPGPTEIGGGYLSLIGKPSEIKLTVDEARSLADENGELFIDGDGDDVVHLTGEWVYVGERVEKGATYYTDASGTVEVTFHNTDTVLV